MLMRLIQDELKREFELQEERKRKLRVIEEQKWIQVEELERIWRMERNGNGI